MDFVADYRLSDYERAERMKAKRKTNKQIKDALEQCGNTVECLGCPYVDNVACKSKLMRDAVKLIEDLEERIAIMTEGGE